MSKQQWTDIILLQLSFGMIEFLMIYKLLVC